MQSHVQDFLIYLAAERGLSQNTLEAYESDIRLFCDFLTYRTYNHWNQVSKEDIIQFIANKKKEGYAASSLERTLVALKVFFRFLKKEGRLDHNVTLYLETPQSWQMIPEVLTYNEIERILAQPDSHTFKGARDKAILELLYSSGLRVSELCQLKIQDVDDSYVCVKKGKGGKDRMVPVGAMAIAAIDRYLGLRLDGDNETLFITSKGGRMTRMRIWALVKEYAKQAGIQKNISPHTFRHTCATDLLKHGADLRIIQDILGHADIGTTERYTHVHNEQMHAAFRQFHPRY